MNIELNKPIKLKNNYLCIYKNKYYKERGTKVSYLIIA